MLAIEIGVVSSIVGADKIGVGTRITEATANNLFDLTLMQIDTWTKSGQPATPE
jgi:hypothetical protein